MIMPGDGAGMHGLYAAACSAPSTPVNRDKYMDMFSARV